MNLYLDSAYIAKCYVSEPDSARVRELARRAASLSSSAWCLAEVACIFHRHYREKSLTRSQSFNLQEAFLTDVTTGVWSLLPLSDGLLRRVPAVVQGLAAGVFLRAGDAVHLLSARDAGFSEIWSNDRHLLSAAPHFDLKGRSV